MTTIQDPVWPGDDVKYSSKGRRTSWIHEITHLHNAVDTRDSLIMFFYKYQLQNLVITAVQHATCGIYSFLKKWQHLGSRVHFGRSGPHQSHMCCITWGWFQTSIDLVSLASRRSVYTVLHLHTPWGSDSNTGDTMLIQIGTMLSSFFVTAA